MVVQLSRTRVPSTRATALAWVCAITVVAALAALLLRPSTASATWRSQSALGTIGHQSSFLQPGGMAVDSTGNVFVADSLNHRIQKFDASGTFLASIGSYGNGPGDLDTPTGLAIDASDQLYVVDTWNARVQKFDASGAYVGELGSWGTGDGEFSEPRGIAVDTNGDIYVSDARDNRVQVFDASGTYLRQFGTHGSGNGQFERPRGLDFAPDGTLLVADAGNHRVQRVSKLGAYISKFGTMGWASGDLAEPGDVDVDSLGNITVADTWNGRVNRYDSSYAFLGDSRGANPVHAWGVEISAVAMSPSEHRIYALDASADKLLVFQSDLTFVEQRFTNQPTDIAFATRMAAAPDGTIYTVDAPNDRVQRWNQAGALLDSWGSYGTGDGQFSRPYGIGVAPDGTVYVADTSNNRVQRFTATGTYLAQFGTSGTGAGQFQYPNGIDIAADGSVYVAECSGDRVQKFTAGGAHLLTIGSAGSGSGEFDCASDVAVAPDSSVFVADRENDRIQHFTSSGVVLGQFGSAGDSPGQFRSPNGLDVSPSGDVYIADNQMGLVHRFTAAGAFVERFAEAIWYNAIDGSYYPHDVAMTSATDAWVVNAGINRVVHWNFTPDPSIAALAQRKNDGATGIAASGTTDQTTVELTFDVSHPEVGETVTPWVEVRPIGTPLSAVCGASVAGVTFSGAPIAIASGGATYAGRVRVTGLVSGTDYHWRACARDTEPNVTPWTSFGGGDGTRDFRVDTSAFTIHGYARRNEGDTMPWQGCASLVQNVRLSVAGAAPVTAGCDRVTGEFAFSGLTKPAAGQLVTVWLSDATSEGVTTMSVAGDASSLIIPVVQGRASIVTELATDTVTRSELQIFDSADDPDVPLDATSAGRITLDSSMELHLGAGVTLQTQGDLWIGSFHVERGATLDTASAQVRVRGSGTRDACDAGPRESTPMCVDPGGTVLRAPPWTRWMYDPADLGRRVAISTDVPYSSLHVADGGTYDLGTRPGQTLDVSSDFFIGNGSRVSSDPHAPDIDVYDLWVGYTASFSGRRAFDIEVREEFAGDGELNVPAARATMRGLSPVSYLASNYRDWNVGSLTVQGANNEHGFGTLGTGADTHDSGGADEPVAQVASANNEAIFVLYNRANGGTGQDWVIRKYRTFFDGLETSFGASGELALAVPGLDHATSIQLDASGNLVVAGSVGGNWAVRMLDPNTGAPVNSFDGDGLWTPGISGEVTALLVHQGSVFVAGSDGTDTWQVRRLSANGALLDTFTWDGDTGSGAEPATITAICAAPEWETGNVTIVGNVGAIGARDWAVGELRESSGTWGWDPFLDPAARPARITSGGTHDAATTCYHTPDRVYIGGTTGDGGVNNVGTIRAYDRSGYPWNYFGTAGVVVIDGPGEDTLTDLNGHDLRNSVQVLSGDATNGGRSVVRLLDWDGHVNPTYGSGGAVVIDPTAGDERPVSLANAWQMSSVLTTTGLGGDDLRITQLNNAGGLQTNWVPGTARVVLLGSGSKLNVHGDLTVGSGAAAHRVHLDTGTYDGDVRVDGALLVDSDAQLRVARHAPLVVRGDTTIRGTLATEDSTVRLQPTSRRTHLDAAASTVFNDLEIDARDAAHDLVVDGTDDVVVAGDFSARGASCTAPLRMRPSGASWTLDTSTGSVASAEHLDLADATFTPARTVSDSIDSGGTSGVTFASPCMVTPDSSPPTDFRVNGVEHALDVADLPPPNFSWTNRTGSTVDAMDVRLTSSSDRGLVALYHFDAGAETVDSSGNGNTLVDTTASSAPGRFGPGRASGSNESAETPTLAIDQEFTAGVWFKRGPLTGGDAPYAVLVDRCDATCAVKQFSIHIDRSSGLMFAEITSGAGAEEHRTWTDATPYLDDEWHYATITHGGSKLRLYLDGEQVGAASTPTTGIDTGAWHSNFGWNFNGTLDEGIVRDVAETSAEVRGYYRTMRPQLDDVWTGTSLPIPATADGADATRWYGGTQGALAHDGARYWASSRMRTNPGADWSAWSSPDWFEISLGDQTTVSLPDGTGAALGAMLPNVDRHAEFRVRVQTTAERGWTLQAFGEDDTYAMSNGLAGANNQLARRTTTSWSPGVGGFAGLTVLNAWGGKGAPWCGGADPTDFANQCYLWPSATSGQRLHSFTGYDLAPRDVDLSVRATASATTRAAEYTGRLSFVALPNP